MRRFRALTNFRSEVLKSDYCEGLTYTIRDGNAALAKEAETWEAEGRIAFLADTGTPGAASPAGTSGAGTVS